MNKTIYEIVDNKTGELIETFSFSVRVRLRKTDVDEYNKKHVILNKRDKK